MAKRLLHEACATYERQYGFSSAVLVMANLYGPGDHFAPETSHVIPAMVRRYVEARTSGADVVVNWGSGNATREFLHVEDAARAIVRAVSADVGPEPINIGTGVEQSIREVAQEIARATGYRGRTEWDTSKPDGTPRRYLDVTRARETLRFEARRSFTEGIDETAAWLEAQLVA